MLDLLARFASEGMRLAVLLLPYHRSSFKYLKQGLSYSNTLNLHQLDFYRPQNPFDDYGPEAELNALSEPALHVHPDATKMVFRIAIIQHEKL